MSTIKKVDVNYRNEKVHIDVESYNSAMECVADCRSRKVVRYSDISHERMNEDFEGVNSYDEAMDLLYNGYSGVVDTLKETIKISNKKCSEDNYNRFTFENNVYGFAPIVPLAIQGVPKSMINMTMKPIKTKVIDIYYDVAVPGFMGADSIIEAGKKLLGSILAFEKSGYRFNVYSINTTTNDDADKMDILAIKVKSAEKPTDFKRMSFPIAHPAFARVIGFDWQSKSPIANRFSGRGYALTSRANDEKANALIKETFGKNAIYISCERVVSRGEKYVKEAIENV